VDLGCGVATWLAAAKELGVRDILGVDGDYISRSQLSIAQECFMAADLTMPLHITRKFDLAISVEVAEHLPESAAKTFVHSLTNLAPVILFSAAIPDQGGKSHLNEQWPAYWINLFATMGYELIDCIRWRIWEMSGIEPHYAQNCLLFVQHDYLINHERLMAERKKYLGYPLRVVHPSMFSDAHNFGDLTLRPLLKIIRHVPSATRRAIANRTRRLLPRKRINRDFGNALSASTPKNRA
jgi:SAM-dependent methyltransferase